MCLKAPDEQKETNWKSANEDEKKEDEVHQGDRDAGQKTIPPTGPTPETQMQGLSCGEGTNACKGRGSSTPRTDKANTGILSEFEGRGNVVSKYSIPVTIVRQLNGKPLWGW